MELGQFSVSLTVKDLQASKAFYQKLGFSIWGGNENENWLIMQNENVVIGLFQGMFEQNIMTFNPKDVRGVQKQLKEQGVELIAECDENTAGPAHIVLKDPDGNQIMFDQH